MHFLKRCSFHHSRALYQYVKQRYPDVHEEREIKNIVTNMVLVTTKPEYICYLDLLTENNPGRHQLCGDVSEPREFRPKVFAGDCSSLHAGQFFSPQHGKYQVSRDRREGGAVERVDVADITSTPSVPTRPVR